MENSLLFGLLKFFTSTARRHPMFCARLVLAPSAAALGCSVRSSEPEEGEMRIGMEFLSSFYSALFWNFFTNSQLW